MCFIGLYVLQPGQTSRLLRRETEEEWMNEKRIRMRATKWTHNVNNEKQSLKWRLNEKEERKTDRDEKEEQEEKKRDWERRRAGLTWWGLLMIEWTMVSWAHIRILCCGGLKHSAALSQVSGPWLWDCSVSIKNNGRRENKSSIKRDVRTEHDQYPGV